MARQGKCFECVLQGEVVRLARARAPGRALRLLLYLWVCFGADRFTHCVAREQNFKQFPSFVERLTGLCDDNVVKVRPRASVVGAWDILLTTGLVADAVGGRRRTLRSRSTCTTSTTSVRSTSKARAGAALEVLDNVRLQWLTPVPIAQASRTMRCARAMSSPGRPRSRASPSKCRSTAGRSGASLSVRKSLVAEAER